MADRFFGVTAKLGRDVEGRAVYNPPTTKGQQYQRGSYAGYPRIDILARRMGER
jgi:hypothetical protein